MNYEMYDEHKKNHYYLVAYEYNCDIKNYYKIICI